MKVSAYFVLVYALVVFVGGMMGYAKADSLPSLVTGTACALVLAGSAIAMFKNRVTGCFAALFVSGILSVFFVYRFALTLAFMPAGLMAILSLILVARLVFMKKV